MSLSHRARVISARRKVVPAFDVSRLLQPRAYLDVLRSVSKSYISESAEVGARVFEPLCNAKGPGMCMARVPRIEWKVPPGAGIVMQDVLQLLPPSEPRHASAILAPIAFAHKWRRRSVFLGVKLRDALADALAAAKISVQLRTRMPA